MDDSKFEASDDSRWPKDRQHVPEFPSLQAKMIQQARSHATFAPKDLAEIIYSGKRNIAIRDEAFARIEKSLGTSDTWKLPRCYAGLTREEIYLEGLKAGKTTFEESRNKNDIFLYGTERCAMGNASPFGIHTFLFVPYLKQQCTPEQAKYWVPLAESGRILGAYCQTELGHGTHVGGIETTATFVTKTDQFVIHSPTTSSTKYWPGAIGFTCTHAIVMARLIIDNNDMGIHPFMVQVRSLLDHKPVSGIELGDIGPKMGYNGTDNGYAVFNNVHIPRSNLLSRYASVKRDGTYHRHHFREKMLYGGMLAGRFLIIRQSAVQLAQALTIATRYSIVREQGRSPFTEEDAAPEVSIIHFKSQNYRLLTLISKAYANHFVRRALEISYMDLKKRQTVDDHSTLSHNHILLSGVKAWATETASNGVEDARKMCGGHGYMMTSGLPDIVNSMTAMATFEGENWVMWQQVALYLMKGLADKDLPVGMQYMRKYRLSQNVLSCTSHGSDFLACSTLLPIFEHRAFRLASAARKLLDSSNLSKSATWNKNMMPLISAARAHIAVYVLANFNSQIAALPPSAVRDVLSKLVILHALTEINSPTAIDAISFVADSHLYLEQLSDIREQIDGLLEELVPDAVALTDAWNFTDASLCSAIGMRDGRAYERIMEWTRQLPINVDAKEHGGVFKEGYETYIKPVICSKL